MSLPNPVASRRTALAGALVGLVVVSGCEDEPRSDEPPRSEPTAPPADADADLVDQVSERITKAWLAVSSARKQSPDLRRSLRPLQRLHEAHLSVLGADQDRNAPAQPVARDLRAVETTLQRQLTDAAVRAESGALAKVLASMAAAVAQQLAVLP